MLVLQFSAESLDLDELIELETAIIQQVGINDDVEGHDFGEHEMNIFIVSSNPVQAFESIFRTLQESGYAFKAGYRLLTGEEYTPIWPIDLDSFEVK